MNVSGKPADRETAEMHEAAEAHALAQLRQSVWEASQFVSLSYITGFVADVCREIKSDDR